MSSEIAKMLEGCVNKAIMIKLKNKRLIRGNLQAFDQHMNLILHKTEDITDNETKNLGYIILRGDNIIAVYLPDK
ncbi:MAG: putative snRNP Sm-like protein [Nitrosopumilales archaeon]|nr:MAG: putative snRNP Sm-like protein [Nitrosopumilales archaeon]